MSTGVNDSYRGHKINVGRLCANGPLLYSCRALNIFDEPNRAAVERAIDTVLDHPAHFGGVIEVLQIAEVESSRHKIGTKLRVEEYAGGMVKVIATGAEGETPYTVVFDVADLPRLAAMFTDMDMQVQTRRMESQRAEAVEGLRARN
jgi:hypothetical protein